MDGCPKCGWHHTDECMGENMAADHNPAIPRTRTPILISAMRLLANQQFWVLEAKGFCRIANPDSWTKATAPDGMPF